MAEKVKLSKDGHSIDFVQTENIPTSMKKFRQSPEIEGFYRFIYENDLQKEAFEILEKIVNQRKMAKKALKQEAAQTKKLEQNQAKEQKAVKLEVKAVTKSVVITKSIPKANVKTSEKVQTKKANDKKATVKTKKK